jgi:hypothetical protein
VIQAVKCFCDALFSKANENLDFSGYQFGIYALD